MASGHEKAETGQESAGRRLLDRVVEIVVLAAAAGLLGVKATGLWALYGW